MAKKAAARTDMASRLENSSPGRVLGYSGVRRLSQLMHMRFLFVASALCVACLGLQVRAQESRFSKYKRHMMPKVGTRVSLVGILKSGKLGWFLAADGWGVYIYATHDSDLPKQNELDRLQDRRVRAIGVLRYHAGSLSERSDVASIPEHFYLDVAEVRVIGLAHRGHGKRAARTRSAYALLATRPNIAPERIRERLSQFSNTLISQHPPGADY